MPRRKPSPARRARLAAMDQALATSQERDITAGIPRAPWWMWALPWWMRRWFVMPAPSPSVHPGTGQHADDDAQKHG